MKRQLACELCERQCSLTFHHLIPRKMHRRSYFQKHYSKAELQDGVMLCVTCHKTIHRFYDEMTLAKSFNTLNALQADEKIQHYLAWVKKQKIQ
ncbi:HNH endonuclease [Alishewanella longhuensis]